MNELGLRVTLFAGQYYGLFDYSRGNALRFYRQASMVSFRNRNAMGVVPIANLHGTEPETHHRVMSVDAHFIQGDGRVSLTINGLVYFLNEPQQWFVQNFYLVPTPEWDFYILSTNFATLPAPAPAPEQGEGQGEGESSGDSSGNVTD